MKRGPFIGLIYNPSQVFFEFKTTVLKRFIALKQQNVYSTGHDK
jgi:hypothetical protein